MKIQIARKQVLESAKIVVGLSAAVGVGILVGSAVKMIPLKEQTLVAKVCVGVGIFVVQSMASDAAMAYVGERIDEIGALLDEVAVAHNAMNLLNTEEVKE